MILCKFNVIHRNKVIHIICIPLIAATLFSLLSFLPYNHTFENLPVIGNYTFGAAEVFGLVLISYYFYLNPLFGVNKILICRF